jgi:ABC-type phosphate/phosphonate transport system substrate-binding protein/DNA-binding CsgD family transcriptional regulator
MLKVLIAGISSILQIIVLWLLTAGLVQADNERRTVTIGVLAFNGKEQAIQRWYPTALYLSQHIRGARFIIKPLSHAGISNAINKGQLDFILTNPGHYVRLEVQFGATRIVTFTSRFEDKQLTRFSSVIFTRKQQDIENLQALKGHRFAAVSKDAFGGYQLAQKLLLDNGIQAEQDLNVLWMGFPQTDIVEAVMQGRADAGTVRSGILEKMAQQGKVDIQQLRILHQRNDSFPLLHSTGLYPEWPLARLPQTDETLAKQVAITLLKMPADAPPAIDSAGAGWTIPLDYTRIHDVFRQLQVAPYRPVPLELKDFWQSYRHWVFLLGFAFIVIASALLFYFKMNRQLKLSQTQLMRHKNQLEAIVEQRTAELIETNNALQNDIQSRIQFEETLHHGCDTLQALYAITLRHDLTREQRLQSIVDLGLQHFSAELVLLSRLNNEIFECCAMSPHGDSTRVPQHAELALQAISEQQMVTKILGDNETCYVACPIQQSDHNGCVLELLLPRSKEEDAENMLGSELSLRILNLLTQWVGHEMILIEQEDRARQKSAYAREQLKDITPREKEVLILVAQGESNKSIARLLDISPKTVELHRSNLNRKTHSSNSTQLVKLAVLAGLSS